MLVNETIILENLFRMLSESRLIESSIFRFGVRVFYCRVRVSQTRVRARVRVIPESGFSSGPSPSPSPVRVSKYAAEVVDWIPALSDPEFQFDLDPPSYQQVTNIIRRMKASGSPCPLDQLFIICFKRCPFLRTYLTDLIRAVWLSGTIPSAWKKACTILIHKKGDTNITSNFRPITLETIPLKVYSLHVYVTLCTHF